jgi:DNA-directed RNA polymerase subunit M
MFPRSGHLACSNPSCGYERDLTSDDRKVVMVKRETEERPAETLVLDDVLETLPKTRVECPKCAHYEAFWVMRQTRAADEPSTRIYRCVKCSHTWREY